MTCDDGDGRSSGPGNYANDPACPLCWIYRRFVVYL